MRTTTIIRMVVIVSSKTYIGELHSCIWVRNNYVTSLGNYLVLQASASLGASVYNPVPAELFRGGSGERLGRANPKWTALIEEVRFA
jgi:hypothetical protein